MKVILLQDVAKIGLRSEVVNVPDGYAMNKLIPQRLAEAATSANIKRIEAEAKKQAADKAGVMSNFEDVLEKLKDKTIEIVAEASDEGKLFEALKPKMIAEAVTAEVKLDLEADWIHTPSPVKNTGEHTVLLSAGDAQGEFTINITSK